MICSEYAHIWRQGFLVLSLCLDHGNLLPLGGEHMHRSDRMGVLGKTVVRNYSPGLEKYPRCYCKQTVLPKQVLENEEMTCVFIIKTLNNAQKFRTQWLAYPEYSIVRSLLTND